MTEMATDDWPDALERAPTRFSARGVRRDQLAVMSNRDMWDLGFSWALRGWGPGYNTPLRAWMSGYRVGQEARRRGYYA